MNFVKKIIINICDIYIEDKDIRESYGDEYADRFGALDPITGKKKISVSKILKRAAAFFILALYIFIIVRITQRGMWKGI